MKLSTYMAVNRFVEFAGGTERLKGGYCLCQNTGTEEVSIPMFYTDTIQPNEVFIVPQLEYEMWSNFISEYLPDLPIVEIERGDLNSKWFLS